GRLKKNRPQLGKLLERKPERRKADEIELIGEIGSREQSIVGRIGQRLDDVLLGQERLRMQLARGGAEQALRLEIVFIAVKAQQIMQRERGLRALDQAAAGAPGGQIAIA